MCVRLRANHRRSERTCTPGCKPIPHARGSLHRTEPISARLQVEPVATVVRRAAGDERADDGLGLAREDGRRVLARRVPHERRVGRKVLHEVVDGLRRVDVRVGRRAALVAADDDARPARHARDPDPRVARRSL